MSFLYDPVTDIDLQVRMAAMLSAKSMILCGATIVLDELQNLDQN